MSTTYKIRASATTDGTFFIDIPISGTIRQVKFTGMLSATGAGPGLATAELSRSPVNQVATNNPRGVITSATWTTALAAQANGVNHTDGTLSEPIKAGERLYVNCAGDFTNVTSLLVNCYITIY